MVLDFLGDIGLEEIGQVAGIAGELAPIFTSSSSQKRAATPQFAVRPMPQQLEDMTALRDWIESNQQPVTVPTRRLTEAEKTDAVFAPQAVQYLEQYFDEQAQPAQPEPDPMPQDAAQSVPVDDVMMRGYSEAQRIASGPSTPKTMNAEQYRQYMKDAQMGLLPQRAEALLNPQSEGYQNQWTGAELNREDILTALGELNLAGDPMNTAYGIAGPDNESIQRRIAERDDALQSVRGLTGPVNYQPPKTSFGRIFGSTILPALGTAAFGAGLPGGVPFTGKQVARGVSTARGLS